MKKFVINLNLLIFLFILFLFILFDKNTLRFQYLFKLNCPTLSENILFFGIDGLNIFFLLLTCFIVFLCSLWVWYDLEYINFIYFSLFLLNLFILASFLVLDLFWFYCFFELILLPMYFLIGLKGSRFRKKKAAYYFFIYTLVGSLFILISLLYIYSETGTTNFLYLQTYWFDFSKQNFLFCCMLLGFLIKIPIYPFHLWLPEAHVEASTIGSVILAALLLKLGCFGIIRFLFSLFPFSYLYFSTVVFTLAFFSAFFSAIAATRQIDFKKLVAYSSINHMSLVFLSCFLYNVQGLQGAVHIMLSHGLVSAGFFFLIGSFYERFKTKNFLYVNGLVQFMPIFVLFFFLFTISNLALPGSWGFYSELLVLISLLQKSISLLILFLLPIFINTWYSIWLLTRISFGFLSSNFVLIMQDLTKREFFVFCFLLIFIYLFGVLPEFISDTTYFSLKGFLVL